MLLCILLWFSRFSRDQPKNWESTTKYSFFFVLMNLYKNSYLIFNTYTTLTFTRGRLVLDWVCLSSGQLDPVEGKMGGHSRQLVAAGCSFHGFHALRFECNEVQLACLLRSRAQLKPFLVTVLTCLFGKESVSDCYIEYFCRIIYQPSTLILTTG